MYLLDTYVDMGNLSCVKRNSTKSQDDTQDECRSSQSGSLEPVFPRDPVNVSSVPRIVLHPGSQRSLNSVSNW